MDNQTTYSPRDDDVRNDYIRALLSAGLPIQHSDVMAVFVWDVAQRLMRLRAENAPVVEKDMKPVSDPEAVAVPFPRTELQKIEDPQMPTWGNGANYEAKPATDEHDDGPF